MPISITLIRFPQLAPVPDLIRLTLMKRISRRRTGCRSYASCISLTTEVDLSLSSNPLRDSGKNRHGLLNILLLDPLGPDFTVAPVARVLSLPKEADWLHVTKHEQYKVN